MCQWWARFHFDHFLDHMTSSSNSKNIWEWIFFILIISYLVPESKPLTWFVKYGQYDITEDVAVHLKFKPNPALKSFLRQMWPHRRSGQEYSHSAPGISQRAAQKTSTLGTSILCSRFHVFVYKSVLVTPYGLYFPPLWPWDMAWGDHKSQQAVFSLYLSSTT